MRHKGIWGGWKGSAPALGADTEQEQDVADRATGSDTFKMVGSYYKDRGCLDGNHASGCPQGN
jgi:hypothetical protein